MGDRQTLIDVAAGRRYWLRNARIPGCLPADDLPARADGLVSETGFAGRIVAPAGGTLGHEMRARGIPVAVASDNTRDAFFANGDMDGLEVFREAVRLLHLDHPIGAWPAAMMDLGRLGSIATGGGAGLVLFDGRDYSELLSRPEVTRVVLPAGWPIDRALPDYRGLDAFMGAANLGGD